ncbi:hypothetical protein [Pseudomonas sp. zfem002]|uniref:hypothetical protein n=1 Tax=Pseudomonas sp. zfem002 TaxID=3078197 RepID=UPI002928E03A|nr:hypothetical protein [Pseudomonas sp. zfem002]MDU9394844.1 hypothetical protein [Pseudomonas sp. zfem002]
MKSEQFFAERRRILAKLDINLTSLTRRGIGFADHPKLKTALGLSSRSLVHHWNKAGKAGLIPGYATQIERVSKTAKIVKTAGWVGVPIGVGASYLNVQEVCSAGDQEACAKVKYTETGSLLGGVMGGAAVGGLLSMGGTAFICGAIGLASAGVGGIACGLVVVGAGSVAGGTGGSWVGDKVGTLIYEQTR